VSSTDERPGGAAGLIERLLCDPGFRAAFRRSPAEACRAHGLDDLADALTPGRSMHTLDLRESKSSLAGVIMALTAEGFGFAELAGLVGHGRHGASGHLDVSGPSSAGHATEAASHFAGAESPVGAGGDPAPVAELLANPRLSLPGQLRSEILQGGVDPRVVSVLEDVVAHHTIAVADLQSVTDPVHAQALDIVSVDGQPVGPGNVAARDLLTEIAALDPSVRPDQIGSPWPIQSPGFFSDPSQQGRLRLSFVSTFESRAGERGARAAQPAPATPSAEGAARSFGTAGSGGSSPAERPHVAAATDVSAPATGSSDSQGGYVSPLPVDAQIGRTDMGVDVDLKPGEPIVAIGDSRVLGIKPDWYDGQPYVALQLLNGPLAGHNYYVAEQVDLAVAAGQIVRQGQVIAHYAPSGTGIEIGWAGPNWEQTLAQAQGNTGDASHNDSPAGLSFHSFLESLGHATSTGTPATPDVTPSPKDSASPEPEAQPPVKPVTAVFAVPPAHRHRAFQRQTVEFRAGSPATSARQAPHDAAAVADVPGSFTVSSPLLTSGQQQFVAHLAQLTGLDPRVISAWALAEESGGAAQARQAAGNFDWLNIGYFDSGPGQIAFDAAFKDPVTAAEQTARFLEGTWGGASSSIRAILATAGQGPPEQIDAIASSNWASSHYGGGANLQGTYDGLSDIQITRT
jgi:hypothetical protein